MNKEKIIDLFLSIGIVFTIIVLIVLACLIFGFAPGVREFIFNL